MNNPSTIKKPNGAMSLLDKFAQINSSIEDARRKVGEVRARLEQTNENINNTREEKTLMLEQTEQAKTEKIRIEKDLKEAKIEHSAKLSEKERVQREQRLAKTVSYIFFSLCTTIYSCTNMTQDIFAAVHNTI